MGLLKLLIALAACLWAGRAGAESITVNRDPETGRFMDVVEMPNPLPAVPKENIKDVFTYTKGKILDWAIASSIEPAYYHDVIKGGGAIGAQLPILYVKDIISGDFGYVSPISDRDEASFAAGASVRVNKILDIYFPEKVEAVKSVLPKRELIWDRLWFGPFVAISFNGADLLAGWKAGLEW